MKKKEISTSGNYKGMGKNPMTRINDKDKK